MSASRRRRVLLQIRATDNGHIIEAKTIEEIVDGIITPSTDHEFHKVQPLPGFSVAQARRLAVYGFQPILERLMVPPSELSTTGAKWLRTAATTYAAQLDSELQIDLQSPKLQIDPNTNEILLKLSFSGHDPNDEHGRPWHFYKEIQLDSVPDIELPTHPMHDKFRWSDTSLDDVGQAEGKLILLSREYQLAKTITAALSGFLGSSSSARQNVESMLVRYATRSAHAHQAFARIATSFTLEQIENMIPWLITRTSKGRLKITVKRELRRSVLGRYKTIKISSPNLQSLLQVLDCMLIKLVTGSNLTTIFEAGAKTADIFFEDKGEGEDSQQDRSAGDDPDIPDTGVSVSRLCTSDDRIHHWHTCAGCLLGRPCMLFGDQRTELMMCSDCTSSGKIAGWKLRDSCMKPSNVSPDSFSRKTVQEALEMWMSRDLDRLGVSADDHAARIDQAWTNLVRIFRTENSQEWYDLYIKDSILAENVARTVGWTGSSYSAFAPSVEAVRQLFVHDGVLQYHADGNLGVTSVSVNRILGSNIKVALKAIAQLQTASNEDEERSAILHLLICGLIRTERTLNARIQRGTLGQHATPYLHNLSRSEFDGEMPVPRYVPNEIVFSPFKAHEAAAQRPAEWRPANYDSYLRPQIEKVAERYGLSDPGERKHWTLNSGATGNVEVPFIFSKFSVVTTWKWHSWYMWCCKRLHRLKQYCDNHLISQYQDDPEARRKLNVETFMLTLLQLFMSMLIANRGILRQYKGQRLRALDAGGYELLLNIRNFFSLSVAHFQHGVVMLTGYDGLSEYPLEHGEEAFKHDRCNIRLETLLVNIARWISNDLIELQNTLNQFRNIRIEEDDFLPGAPRPYLAGRLTTISPEQFANMMSTPISPADENFCFSMSLRKEAHRLLLPASVPELHEAQDSSDEEDEEEFEETFDHIRMNERTSTTQPATNLAETPSTHSNFIERRQTTAPARNQRSTKSLIVQPCAANLGRDISTCFVSAPVQLLHKVFPLRTLIVNARMTDERKKFLSTHVGTDLVDLYRTALDQTHSIFDRLQSHAVSGRKVDRGHTMSFRDAYNSISIAEGASDNEGDWRSRDADANDFLVFIIKQLSSITHSGVTDGELLGDCIGQPNFLPEGGNTVSVDDDAQNVRQIYNVNANDSDLHACYAIHCISEQQCDDMACEAIARMHEVLPTVRFEMTPDLATKYDEVPLEELASRFSHGKHDPRACRTCESCGSGKMISWRQRIVNNPDVMIITIQRVVSFDPINNTTTFVPNRLMSRDINSFNPHPWLKDDLFSEDADPASPAVNYQLVGLIMYLHNPPHYIAFVREKSDHSGAWICFDDTQDHPKYASPFSSEYDNYTETLLVYRKTATRSRCEECLRQHKSCMHDELGHLNSRACYEWLEWQRTRGIRSNDNLSNSEIAAVKESARSYETLMGFENLVEHIILPSHHEIPDSAGPRFSDAMDLMTEQDLDSQNNFDFLNDGSGSDATTVVRLGPRTQYLRSSPPDESDSKSQHGSPKIAAYLADALKNSYAVIDDRHAALTKREEELHDAIRQLKTDREQFQQEQNEFSARTQSLDERQIKVQEAEEDLIRKRNQLETSSESPLTRLRTALLSITITDAMEAMQLMQQTQLALFQSLQDSVTTITSAAQQSPTIGPISVHPHRPPQPAPKTLQWRPAQQPISQQTDSQWTPTPQITSEQISSQQRQFPRIPVQGLRTPAQTRPSQLDIGVPKPFDHPDPILSGGSPDVPELQRTASQETIKSITVVNAGEYAQSKDNPDAALRATNDAGSDHESNTDSTRSEDPTSAKKRRRRTPMTLSPDKKRSKSSTESLVMPDPRSPQKGPGTALKPGALAHSASMTSLRPGSLVHSSSMKSLRDPHAINTSRLRQNLSGHLHTSRPLAIGSKIGQVLRKASGRTPFFKSRSERPTIRSTRTETTNTPHMVIKRIERLRTFNGEQQVWVVRAGMPGGWESLTRVTEEVPELMEEFMRNMRAQSDPSKE